MDGRTTKMERKRKGCVGSAAGESPGKRKAGALKGVSAQKRN